MFEYDSPIKLVISEMQAHQEGEIMKTVQSIGIDVDKQELTKALRYDRGQYDKGFRDGRADAIEEFRTYLKTIEPCEMPQDIWNLGVDNTCDKMMNE